MPSNGTLVANSVSSPVTVVTVNFSSLRKDVMYLHSIGSKQIALVANDVTRYHEYALSSQPGACRTNYSAKWPLAM